MTIRKPSAVVVARVCPTGYSMGIGGEHLHRHSPAMTATIYIRKTDLAFHIFEDQQGSRIQRKIGQFATWEQLLSAIRSEFQGRQIVPQF